MDSLGGTGKIFVTKLLLAKVIKGIVLAVTSSGIAANLLPSGKTAHSVFKLPVNLTSSDSATFNVSKGSDKADLLKRRDLIACDESMMAHKGALQTLDRTFRDIRD